MAADSIDDEDLPKKPSLWLAALAQLPGFPPEERPKLPEVNPRVAREVSAATGEDDEA